MKKLFFLLIFCCGSIIAQDLEAVFQKANTAYNQGNYTEAIEGYNEILESGNISAELYYNLANSYYKENKVAPSIYYYEKALQLDPNDEDIRNNLAFAQSMAIDDIQESPRVGFDAFYSDMTSSLSYNGWAWVAVTFSVLFAVFFLIYYFSIVSLLKRLFFTLALVSVIIAVGSVYFAYSQEQNMKNSRYAIVFAEEAIVRSEPTLRSEEAFLLHEGTKLQVLETYQNWIKLELANGTQGWIDKSTVRLL